MTVTTRSEAETGSLGRELGQSLASPTVILLAGDLGAGKTAFVRGLAEGLGIDPEHVSSPTFALIQEYRGGRLPLHHVDLYRLRAIEADDLGLDDLAFDEGVTAIEWPDRWLHAPDNAVRVSILATGEDERVITIEGLTTTPTGSSALPS